jgi:hypothetical protein
MNKIKKQIWSKTTLQCYGDNAGITVFPDISLSEELTVLNAMLWSGDQVNDFNEMLSSCTEDQIGRSLL